MAEVLLAVPTLADAAADQVTTMAEESDNVHVVGRVTSANDIARTLTAATTPIDVLLLHEDLGPIPVLELARDLNRRFPDTGLVLLTEDPGPDLLRAAMFAGIRGVVTVPLALEEFLSTVSMAADWANTVRGRFAEAVDVDGHAAVGQMVAFAGAKGGVGATLAATTFALNQAAQHPDRTVCLVDMDLQAGDVRAYLDITHQRSITDLVAVANELTTRHFDEALFRHTSGMRVLLPPLDGELAEDVDTAAARQILGALRARFDLLVVDVGATMNEATATAVEMSDAVLVVTTTDVPALRAANRLLALWDRLAIRREGIHAVLNRVSRDSEVQPDLCARVLKAPTLATTLASRFRDVEYAVNTGRLQASGVWQEPMTRLAAEIDDIVRQAAAKGDADEVVRTAARLQSRVAAGEQGQATVDFVASLPVIALALMMAWQLALVGWTYTQTSDASRMAARQFGVSEGLDANGDGVYDDVARTARDRLPAGWRPGTEVRQAGSEITVTVPVPSVLPLFESLGSVSSTSGGVRE